MFLMISTPPPPTPLLIKLLITSGCYRRRGDIPQVLSAARPSGPENLHRRESLPVDRPLESQPFFFFLFCYFTACKWLLSLPPMTATTAASTQRPSPIVGPLLWPALQGVAAAPPSPPLFFFFFQLSRNEDQAWATRLFHKVLLCQQAHQLGCLKFYHRHGRQISAAPQKPTQPGPAPVEPEVIRR